MPQSRFSKLMKQKQEQERKDNAPKPPKKISDFCLGKCDPEVYGMKDGRPDVYCNGCGRNLGR